MSCGKCGKRSDCKEICKEVEALLPKPRSGGHKKEKSVDPKIFPRINKAKTEIEDVEDKEIRELMRSKIEKPISYRKEPVIYNNNWELD
jgi:hypothetical protein